MRRFLVLPVVFLSCFSIAHGQGCVAVKNLAGFGQFAALGYKETPDTWSLDINNRYFEAWECLSGYEQTRSVDGNTLYEYAVNFELMKELKNGWSLGFDLPIAANETTGTNSDGLLTCAAFFRGERYPFHRLQMAARYESSPKRQYSAWTRH